MINSQDFRNHHPKHDSSLSSICAEIFSSQKNLSTIDGFISGSLIRFFKIKNEDFITYRITRSSFVFKSHKRILNNVYGIIFLQVHVNRIQILNHYFTLFFCSIPRFLRGKYNLVLSLKIQISIFDIKKTKTKSCNLV